MMAASASMRLPGAARAAFVVVVCLTTLAGCRAEEQQRGSTDLTPGVYKGVVDEPIDEATREALKKRIEGHAF